MTEQYVAPSVAVSRHYKSCAKSRGETRVKDCAAMFQNSTRDTSMKRFGRKLTKNYHAVLKDKELVNYFLVRLK